MKRWIALLALLALPLCAAASAQENTMPPERMERTGESRPGGPGGPGGQGGRGQGMAEAEPDAALQAILDEVQDQYELLTFTDPETGAELQYQLFTPADCDPEGKYPLVMFIPDSRAPGRDVSYVLSIGWGGVIWATAAEQEKHPCFVMIPVFTETVVDDAFNTSPQIATAVRIIEHLIQTCPIDADRIYATGQSMGGMTSFYLNATIPDLFAASLFVGSQWDNSVLSVLETDRFFYIVSAGDEKASTGQAGLKAVFDADGVAYASAQWSAQDDAQTQNEAVRALIAQGLDANFVTFTRGTTLTEGMSGSEHLTSFDYAYRLEAVRDWLFEQSR